MALSHDPVRELAIRPDSSAHAELRALPAHANANTSKLIRDLEVASHAVTKVD